MLIGEVAQRSGVSARMLRHYDAIGLVRPTGRTAGGYREYSDADLRRLFHVESLRSLGLSLVEVRRALDDPGFAPSDLVDDLIGATRERIADAEDLLRRLEQVRASGADAWPDALRTVALVRGLHSDDPVRRQRSALSADRTEATGLAGTLAESLLAEADENAAGVLRWAVERAGGEALAVLAPALDSPEPAVRLRAVTAIAEISAADADAVLVGALEHPDEAVRHRAALALGTRGELRAVPVLAGMVARGDRDVEAAEALGALADRHGCADAVVGVLAEQSATRHDDPAARMRLAQALAELPAAAARPALEALAHDSHPDVVRTATYVLQRGGASGT
ncbi:HEAT repeat domain-containing protein [Georgenia faecalis]|uniref:HEAT repeat domain-containing protein n=1 Tax=Georgenia faecalis TaxID=2483799 RepID=A0ABV9D947_9MICO|nr:HEAT repeat domain-containing protein [Georgenia faecalis]